MSNLTKRVLLVSSVLALSACVAQPESVSYGRPGLQSSNVAINNRVGAIVDQAISDGSLTETENAACEARARMSYNSSVRDNTYLYCVQAAMLRRVN